MLPVAAHRELDADRELVLGAQRGDQRAFEQLVRRHADRVHGMVVRLIDDEHEAQDVTQDTFVRAWHALDRFRGESRFTTWLYRIAINEAHRYQKRHGHRLWRIARRLDDDGPDIPDRSSGPYERAASHDLKRALEHAIRALPAEHRAAVVLRDIEGLSTGEAAAIVGVSEAAFKSRLHRGRMTLQEAVKGYLKEGNDATS